MYICKHACMYVRMYVVHDCKKYLYMYMCMYTDMYMYVETTGNCRHDFFEHTSTGSRSGDVG